MKYTHKLPEPQIIFKCLGTSLTKRSQKTLHVKIFILTRLNKGIFVIMP